MTKCYKVGCALPARLTLQLSIPEDLNRTPHARLLVGPAWIHLGARYLTSRQVTTSRAALPAINDAQNSKRRSKPTVDVNSTHSLVLSSYEDKPCKKCLQCEHVKLVVDFQTVFTNVDGREDFCRACRAVVTGKRSGRPLHHIGLSVQEAWEKGKRCAKCKQFKELRVYNKMNIQKDGVDYYCRACRATNQIAGPKRGPQVTHKQCARCGEVKDASKYGAYCRNSSGLQHSCKVCTILEKSEYLERIKLLNMHMLRESKFCGICRQVKPTAKFYSCPERLDGLSTYCRNCQCKKYGGKGLEDE